MTITDNGPGIVRAQVENIFGRLLYGSKFHRLKMSRGQQGIGISAAGMYGLMTTGKPDGHHDQAGNAKAGPPPRAGDGHQQEQARGDGRYRDGRVPRDLSGTGTSVAIDLEARYQRGKGSVEAYLEQTAIANPHARDHVRAPGQGRGGSRARGRARSVREGTTTEGRRGEGPSRSRRGSTASARSRADDGARGPDRVPARGRGEPARDRARSSRTRTGWSSGNFLGMLKTTKEKQLGGFFKREFCRVTPTVVGQVTEAASTKGKTRSPGRRGSRTSPRGRGEDLPRRSRTRSCAAPPTDCLAPIGVRTMLAGLLKGVRRSSTRPARAAPRCTGATRSRSRRRSPTAGTCRRTSRRG